MYVKTCSDRYEIKMQFFAVHGIRTPKLLTAGSSNAQESEHEMNSLLFLSS